eukprot:COSAG03_NODE_1366_length_4248_cov_171.653651_2_plen_1004_part_01
MQSAAAGSGTALSSTMAIEYLNAKDTVTNTRLSCLAQLHKALEGGALPGAAEIAATVQAVLRNVPVGNIRVRREALAIVSLLAVRMGAEFRQFLPKTMPLLVLRMGDHAAAQRMVAEAAIEAFETVQAVVGVRPVYEQLLAAKSFEHKSWHVRQQLFDALGSTLTKYGAADLPLEPLLERILSGLNDRAVGARDAAANATVRLYERVGVALTKELQSSGLRDGQLRALEARFASSGNVDSACVVPLRPPPGSAGRSARPELSARRPKASAPSSGRDRPSVQQQLFKTPGSSGGASRRPGRESSSPPQRGALAPHSPVTIRSEAELKAEFSSLSDGLQRADWNERLLCLRRLGAVVVSGATTSFLAFTELLWRSPLRHAITAQFEDPRSTIVREVCTVIAQLAVCCGDQLCKLAEYWVPELLKLCYNSVQIIRDSADQCVATVIQHTQAPRLLPRIAHAGSSSRHALLREKSMSFLTVAMTHWSAPAVEKGDSLKDVCESVRLGLNDASPDTRAAARRAYCALSARWAQQAADMQGRLPAKVLNALATHASSPTVSAVPPTTPVLQLMTASEAAATHGLATPVATDAATSAGTAEMGRTQSSDASPVADLLRSERKARQAAQIEQQRYARDEAGIDQELQSVQHELRTTSAELEEAAGSPRASFPPPSPVASRSPVPAVQGIDDLWAGMSASPAAGAREAVGRAAQPPPVISVRTDDAAVGFTPPPIVGAVDSNDDPWSAMVMGGPAAGPGTSPATAAIGFTPPPIPPTPEGWISDSGDTDTMVIGPSASVPRIDPPTPAEIMPAGRKYRCVKKSQIRAGMAMTSEKAGVLPLGAVITALEGARNEAGVLRVRFQLKDGALSLSGWVSEFAADGQMCLAAVTRPELEPEPEQPPAGIGLGAAATTPSPVVPRALSFQSPALEPDGPPPLLRSPEEQRASERDPQRERERPAARTAWSPAETAAPSPALSPPSSRASPQVAAAPLPPVMPPPTTNDSDDAGDEDPP